MTEAERKRWWRFVAFGVVGGGLAFCSWIEFIRPATAEPAPKPTAQLNDQTYPVPGALSQSAHQANPSTVQQPGDVALAAGTMPETSQGMGISGPVVPAVAPAGFGMKGPRDLDAGLIGTATPLPALPPIPNPEPSAAPAAIPLPIPVIPPVSSQPVVPPDNFAIPPAPPAPVTPILPIPTPVNPSPPPSGALPNGGDITPPPNLAPVTPPIQFPDTIQPVMPVLPNSSLQGGNGGINVKMENPPTSVGSGPGPLGIQATSPAPGVGQPVIPQTTGNPGTPAVPMVGIPSPSTGVIDRPKSPEALVPNVEKDFFSSPALLLNEPNAPGDNTMLKYHQQAAALAILGGMFLAPTMPARASDPAKDDKLELAQLKAQIDTANQKLTDIQAELKKLTELLNGKKDEKGFTLPSDPGVVAQIKSLKDKLEQIDKDLTNFKSQTSSSLRMQAPVNPIVDPRTGKGIVRIVNDYPVQISMVINGFSYQVPPSQVRDVDVPMGDFTYQLVQSGAAPKTSFIKEKETVTLRIK